MQARRCDAELLPRASMWAKRKPMSDAMTAVLRVACPDRRGLVAAVAGAVLGASGNIRAAEQHSDPISRRFFQRMLIEVSSEQAEVLRVSLQDLANRFAMAWRLDLQGHQPPVALFVSKQLHCLHDLIDRFDRAELAGRLALIVSNHEVGIREGERHGVPTLFTPFGDRSVAAIEAEQLAALAEARIELLVMARYMRVLSPKFLQTFSGAVINIHHSFLPAFAGGKPYHQAFERGVKCIGATAHYATDALDEGPIIEQDVVRVSHRDTVPDLAQKGRDVERVVLARAVRWHLEGRVMVDSGRTVVFA